MNQPPLIVHTESSRVWGGQEIRVLTELTAMRNRGCRVALIATEGAPIVSRARAAELPVHTLPAFRKLHPNTWPRLARLVRQLRPAVLNTHSSEDSWTAAPLARVLGVPLVLRTRHVLSAVSSTVSYRFPHELLACSVAIADALTQQGLPRAHINVVPTGNDAERFRFSPEKRAEMRQRFGLEDTDVLIGNVGFLRAYKGLDFILDTLAGLEARYRVMLVGDGDLRTALETQAARLGLQDRVIFAGHQERPEDFLHAFDIFFFSSNAAEGISQSLVQALLNGLPIVACDLSSTVEALEGVAASCLVAYGDVAAARRALAGPSALPRRDPARMSAQHEAIAARYGLPAMTARLEAIYARYGIVLPADEKGG